MKAGNPIKKPSAVRSVFSLVHLGKASLIVILLAAGIRVCYAASCYPTNAPRLVFSPYHPISLHPEDIETVIDFFCAPAFQGNKLHVSVSVQGNTQSLAYQMRNAVGDTIRYGLFIDPARSIPLTSGITLPLRDINPGTKTFSVILYGRIFASQKTAGVGQYRGFVNLLLNY